MAGAYNLYGKGCANLAAVTSTSYVTTDSVTVATAVMVSGPDIKSGVAGSIYAAYEDLWERLNDGQTGLPPTLTTTELEALTDVDDGVEAINSTRSRKEISINGVFRDTTRKFTVTGITASATQAQGNGILTGDVNIIGTVVNNNDTVTLPSAVTGITIIIVNNGTKKIKIFPNTADNLGAGLNSSITLAAGSSIIFHCYDATNWMST